MPEWPELRVMQERIAAALVGKKIVAVRVGDPVVLRAVKPVDELLVGRTLRAVTHHGKFLIFAFDGLEMTVNPMLAGIFSLQPAGAKATRRLAREGRDAPVLPGGAGRGGARGRGGGGGGAAGARRHGTPAHEGARPRRQALPAMRCRPHAAAQGAGRCGSLPEVAAGP